MLLYSLITFQEFGGNIDKDTSRIHYLAQPITARYVRFHPITWHRGIAMRAGILGRIHTGECGAGFTKPNSASPCGESNFYLIDALLKNL